VGCGGNLRAVQVHRGRGWRLKLLPTEEGATSPSVKAKEGGAYPARLRFNRILKIEVPEEVLRREEMGMHRRSQPNVATFIKGTHA